MRIFAPDWVSKWMQIFGMKEDDALEDRLVTKQIERAQRKVEAHNFDIRKHLLDYDDVANDQRKVIYEQRNDLLEATDVGEGVVGIRHDVVESLAKQFVPPNSIDDQWDLEGLARALEQDFGIAVDAKRYVEGGDEQTAEHIWKRVRDDVDRHFREKEAQFGSEQMRAIEKFFMLQVLDQAWKEHLASMDYLRQGIHLRGYAQKQPKQEFKREAFEMFQQMLERVRNELVTILARVRVRSDEEIAQLEAEQQRRQERAPIEFQHQDLTGFADEAEAHGVALEAPPAVVAVAQPSHRDAPKVGRNDPCPCGSGKKYKQCHGRIA
jgi:preprotein translocase subunit SecA